MVPPPTEPRAGEAPVFSREDEDGYARHFRDFGFVVVGGVLETSRVQATIDEIWKSPSLLGGHSGLDREDPSTWDTETWPAGCRNFLDPLDPCVEVESWRNRVDPVVNRVFDVLWHGCPELCSREEAPGDALASEGSLVMSVDRFGLMRPTRLRRKTAGGYAADDVEEKPEWRTSRNWLHWDQNPWSSPDFQAMQGLLSLAGGCSTSGGFATVPSFHKEFALWGEEHPEGSIPKRSAKMVPFPVPLEDEMQGRRIQVMVPPGGLLVWDSRMPHENFPNEGSSWRMVQYVTCKRLAAEDLTRRAAAWHAGLRTGLVPASFARRFSPKEQIRLGMAESEQDHSVLQQAIEAGECLTVEALEAAQQLRRAYRLKQTAELPHELQEASSLFRSAFSVNPELKEPLQRIAMAESTYLPFWLL